MEQGIYSIQFHLFENGDESTASKNLTDFVKTCKTDFIYDETYDIFDEYTYKAYKLLSGQSIVPFGFNRVVLDSQSHCELKSPG